MFHRTRWLGAATLGAAALALPATATAATRIVYAGPPPGVKQVVAKLGATRLKAYQPDINAFFDRHATIHVGDSISFRLRGFHTVDIPARGGRDLPFIVTGATVTGSNDAAGSPFWFNGKVPSLGFNPALFKPQGSVTFNGAQRYDTGLPLGSGTPKPFVVKFTRAGTYKYFCDVHPGMIGYITVKPAAARIPTAKQDAAAQLKQLTTNITDAVKLAHAKLPSDTVSLGESAPGGVELYAMFPSTLTVKTGTVVTFRMSAHTFEDHTATFGPTAVLKALVKNFGPSLPPEGAYPSDPTQPVKESATEHGNGFANTGVLDQDPTTKTIPAASRVQFTTPGTYQYICLIHPFMRGTIIVK